MARSIVVKGVELPERLLDETALFLHRIITDLPAEKQRMLERLDSSDEDLVGRYRALRATTIARSILRLSSTLERRGSHAVDCDTGREAIALIEETSDLAIVLMDIMMPEMDGYPTIENIRRNPRYPAADRGLDRQGDEGRPGECLEAALRLSRQPVNTEHSLRTADAAPSLGLPDDDKVNVLLVDDQPESCSPTRKFSRSRGKSHQSVVRA